MGDGGRLVGWFSVCANVTAVRIISNVTFVFIFLFSFCKESRLCRDGCLNRFLGFARNDNERLRCLLIYMGQGNWSIFKFGKGIYDVWIFAGC